MKLVVVPPPLTSDALAAGAIDGFCVGAPWNMIASERGSGRIVAAKQDIWPLAPEKVLGLRRIGPRPMPIRSPASSSRSIAPRAGATIPTITPSSPRS